MCYIQTGILNLLSIAVNNWCLYLLLFSKPFCSLRIIGIIRSRWWRWPPEHHFFWKLYGDRYEIWKGLRCLNMSLWHLGRNTCYFPPRINASRGTKQEWNLELYHRSKCHRLTGETFNRHALCFEIQIEYLTPPLKVIIICVCNVISHFAPQLFFFFCPPFFHTRLKMVRPLILGRTLQWQPIMVRNCPIVSYFYMKQSEMLYLRIES